MPRKTSKNNTTELSHSLFAARSFFGNGEFTNASRKTIGLQKLQKTHEPGPRQQAGCPRLWRVFSSLVRLCWLKIVSQATKTATGLASIQLSLQFHMMPCSNVFLHVLIDDFNQTSWCIFLFQTVGNFFCLFFD